MISDQKIFVKRDFYSETSRKLQDENQSRKLADQLAKTRLHSKLNDEDCKVISNAEFFFLATADKFGCPDCSIKGGNPGFVEIVNANTLSFPDYDGNGMFRSLGNIDVNPYIGLLFLAFNGELRKLRINGKAKIVRIGDQPNFDKMQKDISHRINVRIDIQDIFPNCSRYLPTIKLEERSIYNPAAGYEPPEPHWKSKPDLKDFLPPS